MTALLEQVKNSLRLNLRNRMAMIYGYVFPLIFLVAFWTIYRNERVPLLHHMGELLTVTILGGACFGLPTTLVSERERGVWRRYRLSPTPAWIFIANVLLTRYVLVLTSALLQITLALAVGMTFPKHPFQLLIAFTIASIAFLGMGLQIAMLADSVPAVQALGQCIFLPMLIVGGVAVRLASLPHWAVVLSSFLPGRYSVEALQSAVTGSGSPAYFNLVGLTLFGLAGAVAAIASFRWNPSSIRTATETKGWLAAALILWIAIGCTAVRTGRSNLSEEEQPQEITQLPQQASHEARPVLSPSESLPTTAPEQRLQTKELPDLKRWQDVTSAYIANLAFDRLPPDEGLISPIAHNGDVSDPDANEQLELIRSQLSTWAPGKVADPLQRARNELYVAGVPDLLQIAPIERFVPLLVFSRLRADISAKDLPKILYWIATHPDEGDDDAMQEMPLFQLPIPTGRKRAVRGRAMIYAMKMLARQREAVY